LIVESAGIKKQHLKLVYFNPGGVSKILFLVLCLQHSKSKLMDRTLQIQFVYVMYFLHRLIISRCWRKCKSHFFAKRGVLCSIYNSNCKLNY